VPATVVDDAAAPESAFDSAQRQHLARLEGTHFWFAARTALVTTSIEQLSAPAPVLDVGCGTGALAARLRDRDGRAWGLDAAGIVDVVADALQLPVRDSSVGTLLLLDVVEHLDDRAALAEVRRVLVPNGLLLLTVPAHPWLWSARDERAGHQRRYRRRDLTALLTARGFALDRIVGFQLALLPAAAVTRWVGRRVPRAIAVEDSPPRFVDAILRRVLRAELVIGRHVPIPTGTSYFAVARRR
jgi:SAM-dependent methyltransferase